MIPKLLTLLLSLTSITALYFEINEKEKKCFIEELPEDTICSGNYKAEIFDEESNSFIESPQGMGMLVEILNPDKEMMLSRTYGSSGKFSFKSAHDHPGDHSICIHSNSTKWAF